jgi:acyl-CoA thioester hydrolase
MKKYHKPLIVKAADLDELHHVNNVRYLDWVQQISKEHWEVLTNKAWEQQYFWVVKRHQITYYSPALLGEALILTTYVREASGATSKRKVEIRKSQEDGLVAECLTDWVLLDRQTGKPARIPREMKEIFQ